MKRMGKTIIFLFTIFFMPSLVFLLEESHGAEFCVSDESGLQNALTDAAANGENNIIKVVQGNYNGAFAYDSSEGHNISVLGGYTSGCATMVLNSANTVLDSAGSGTVLDLSDSAGGDILIIRQHTYTIIYSGGIRQLWLDVIYELTMIEILMELER